MIFRLPERKAYFWLFFVLCWSVLASCSSAPKQPPDAIYIDRNTAANFLGLSNREANRGKYNDALVYLEEARRLAIACDDPPLLTQTALARGNILFSLGRHDEAFRNWEAAREEGEKNNLGDLALLAQIYMLRGRLILFDGSGDTVQDMRDQATRYVSSIRSDTHAQAAGWLVVGMAEKELQRYSEAERAARRALDIHQKNMSLEEAAYDWYFIASVYSVSGRYDDALAALGNAINFDRRAENGFGLASSWEAMGEVHLKAGNTAEAERAFHRAADIYRAIRLDEMAKRIEAP